ncbi:hypothetical protein MPER_03816, partial [Moniliophthora perniciosa FA553]
MRKRRGPTLLKGIDKKNWEECKRSKDASELANNSQTTDNQQPIPLNIPAQYKLTGFKLSKMTQKSAYKALREIKMKSYQRRSRTAGNLDGIRATIKQNFGFSPSDRTIWKTLRNKDFTREVRYFLWMLLHDAYMTGKNWQRPGYRPELQARAHCSHDNALDSMEHILTQCACNGQGRVWELAGKIWERKGYVWQKPNIPAILDARSPPPE